MSLLLKLYEGWRNTNPTFCTWSQISCWNYHWPLYCKIFFLMWRIIGKQQNKIFCNWKTFLAFTKHSTVECWMNRKETSLCIELLRFFQPFKEAVIKDENTDIWKPRYLLMQVSAETDFSLPQPRPAAFTS